MENLNSQQQQELKASESGDDANSSFDLDALDPEQRQKVEEELKTELAKTEDEIQTLRQVLAARIKHSHDLKRKLGIGVWKELQNDLQQGIKNVQETTARLLLIPLSIISYQTNNNYLNYRSITSSGLGLFNTPYQKTSETVKFAAEKTTDIFGSLGDSIGRKLVDVKNSSAFKSFEERVGSTMSKTGLTPTTSNNNNNNSNQTASEPTVNLPAANE